MRSSSWFLWWWYLSLDQNDMKRQVKCLSERSVLHASAKTLRLETRQHEENSRKVREVMGSKPGRNWFMLGVRWEPLEGWAEEWYAWFGFNWMTVSTGYRMTEQDWEQDLGDQWEGYHNKPGARWCSLAQRGSTGGNEKRACSGGGSPWHVHMLFFFSHITSHSLWI